MIGDSTVWPVTANTTIVDFTATRTLLLAQAGVINVNVTFLSPITPNDLVTQSLPFGYVSLTVESSDGAEHDVSVYMDISAGMCFHSLSP